MQKLKVHGDFFIDPAEKLEDIKEVVEGLDRDFDRKELINEIDDIDAELIGFSAQDIADVLEKFRGEEK